MYVDAMQTIESTGSDADFATVYSLVKKIDEQLTTKTLHDDNNDVKPLCSNKVLPFLPGSAFTKTEEVEIIQQFEFTVDPQKYPNVDNPSGKIDMYDLFMAFVRKIFPPIFQCSFISSSDDIMGKSGVAAIQGAKCLNASDYSGAAPSACASEEYTSPSYTVATTGREWAANMVYVEASTLQSEAYYTDEWKNYSIEQNPLPDKDQCNAYFIATESPCNGDCIVSRLCDWTTTGAIIAEYSIEGSEEVVSTGGSLGSVNPALGRPYIHTSEEENTDKIAATPVCGLEAIYPKYVEEYSAVSDLQINDIVNVYYPYILNGYCQEFDPSTSTPSDFAEEYGPPYESDEATYSWMAVSMCDYTHEYSANQEDVKVAIRLNKFKTQINIDGQTVDKYIGIPTALRIRLKGVYRPAIRKVWYDTIFHTLRHCMGYVPYNKYSSEEPYALGNTWDTTIHTYIQDCANYGAMAYDAFHPAGTFTDNYKATNWLDIWTEQYLLGRKGAICDNGHAASDSYEVPGGLCAPERETGPQVNTISAKTCQYGYTKGKLHLPWHGGCKNSFCDNSTEESDNDNDNNNTSPANSTEEDDSEYSSDASGDSFLAAHGDTFNILYDLYDTIDKHKLSEQDICSDVRVLDIGFDVTSFAYSDVTYSWFSTEKLLEIYRTQAAFSSYIDVNETPHFLLIRGMIYSALEHHYPLLNPGVYIGCAAEKCYQYSWADIYLYSAGYLVEELVVSADIVADKEYETILKYSTADHTHYITTNPEEYVWLDRTIKYGTATAASLMFDSSCITTDNNKPDTVVTEISTGTEASSQNQYSITLQPANVLDNHSKWVVSSYTLYAGIPILSGLDTVRVSLSGCNELLAPAWEIGMLAKKSIEPMPIEADTNIFTKIDWVWRTSEGDNVQTTIAPLPQEYYSMLVEHDIEDLTLNVLNPKSYGYFKCITSPYISTDEHEKWYPLYKSGGGTVELRASLLKNGTSNDTAIKYYSSGDVLYSIDVSYSTGTANTRQFYGVIALAIIVHPYGDSSSGDAALASFGAEALSAHRDTVMNWEVRYETTDGEPEATQGNIEFKAYSATSDSTGCKEIFNSVMFEEGGTAAKKTISIYVSKP